MGNNINKTLVDLLHRLLADVRSLTFKTQMYHWNVTGINFVPLHEMFQQQYEDLWLAQDDIAEKIRALGFIIDPDMVEMFHSAIPATNLNASVPEEMVGNLLDDHQLIQTNIIAAIKEAEMVGEFAVMDYLTERLDIHQKTAWFLKATSGK